MVGTLCAEIYREENYFNAFTDKIVYNGLDLDNSYWLIVSHGVAC